MIKSVHLTNFFSFKDCNIQFEDDVSILLGINGSGKSNLIKAIQLLKEGVTGNGLNELILERWGGWDNVYCKSTEKSQFQNKIGLEFELDGRILARFGFHFRESVIYKIVLIKKPNIDNFFVSETLQTASGFTYLDFYNGEGKLHEKAGVNGEIADAEYPNPEKGKLISYKDYNPQELVLAKVFDADRYYAIDTVRKALSEIAVYTYFDTTPASKIRSSMKSTGGKRLSPDGNNLPQIINTIKLKHKSAYRRVEELLREVNENFNGFDFHFLGSGTFELMLDEVGLESAIHVTHISDGTLRYLCLLAILYNPDRGSFICIDEPETGLHPDMMLNVTNAILEASEHSSILIATHNENVVDAFDIPQIRIFEKGLDNTSTVKTFTESDFEGWYEKFRPGRMWRQGDLGGKRW